MDRARLLLFSLDKDAVENHTATIEERLKRKGVEYTGPRTPPVLESTIAVDDIESTQPREWAADPPDWASRLTISDAEIARLKEAGRVEQRDQFVLFARTFKVRDHSVIRDLMEISLPEGVCLQVDVDVVTAPSARDNSPYTYDPGRDHVTDRDY